MSSLLDSVDLRTQLAGHNRLELLMFRLRGRQRFGINVFKVQEVIQCPSLTQVPQSNSAVRGVAHLRGRTIPVMDMGMAIGCRPLEDLSKANVVVTEFNRKVQGFLVGNVERIVNTNWSDIKPPPKLAAQSSYVTAVTEVDGELVEIIDVEKILSEVLGQCDEVSQELIGDAHSGARQEHHILVVDDSSVARNQIRRTLDQMGIKSTLANDGREGLERLREFVADGRPITEKLSMVISDVEMPQMDGYTLTTEIRRDPLLEGVYVILHTSLSGVFNKNMVEGVGANEFIPKFNADDLAAKVIEVLKLDTPQDTQDGA